MWLNEIVLHQGVIRLSVDSDEDPFTLFERSPSMLMYSCKWGLGVARRWLCRPSRRVNVCLPVLKWAVKEVEEGW